MRITPEQWSVLSRLFDEALELTPQTRAAWLESQRELDPAVLDKLRSMLERHARIETSDFLNTLPKIAAAEEPTGAGGFMSPAPGVIVGPYVLEQEVGRGGMGVVWRAWPADGLVKRPVALKLLYPGLHGSDLLARFGRERDILASLTHPNIARLYDAGATAAGQPFLALEYVEGLPLTVYCDQHRLDIRRRLQLMCQVLQAVQYAHSHLVIHRDLKPSNILVTADAQVLLLDFGIAKLMSDTQAQGNPPTRMGFVAMTPDYASPEQIAGDAVSTASDVYALGVILYELLTGERPGRLKRGSQSRLEAAVLSVEPARPSEIAADETKAGTRATTPTRLSKVLRGDLDNILLKALKESASERYLTADAFSQDLERYLAGEPVLARPDRFWYRARKFVVRHRTVVSLATVTGLALVGGFVVALWQARVAAGEARVAAAAQEFLIRIFESNSSAEADPVKARSRTARELLDAGASQVDVALHDAPVARLRVLATLETLYSEDLGLHDKAAELGRKRVSGAKELYGPNDVRVADALVDLAGDLYESSSPSDEALVLAEADRILTGAHDFSSKTRADFYLRQAEVHQSSDLEQTISFARRAVELLRRQPPSVNLANALGMEGIAHTARDENRDAERVLTEALSLSGTLRGNLKRALPIFYSYLAQAQSSLGEYSRAEQSYRRALEVARRFDGEEHENVLQSKLRLGGFLSRTGRPREGLQLLREALDLAERTQSGTEGFHTPRVLYELGKSLLLFGNPGEALTVLNRAIELRRSQDRDRGGTRMLAQMLEARADSKINTGAFDLARTDLEEAAAIRERIKDLPGSERLNAALLVRARLAAATGKSAEAAATLNTIVLGGQADGLAPIRLDVELERAQLSLQTTNFTDASDQAERLRTRIEASNAAPYLADFTSRAVHLEGEAQFRLHHADKALPLLQEAIRLDNELQDIAHSRRLTQANQLLSACSGLRAAQPR
jgi:serine/threonine-protein kinase